MGTWMMPWPSKNRANRRRHRIMRVLVHSSTKWYGHARRSASCQTHQCPVSSRKGTGLLSMQEPTNTAARDATPPTPDHSVLFFRAGCCRMAGTCYCSAVVERRPRSATRLRCVSCERGEREDVVRPSRRSETLKTADRPRLISHSG